MLPESNGHLIRQVLIGSFIVIRPSLKTRFSWQPTFLATLANCEQTQSHLYTFQTLQSSTIFFPSSTKTWSLNQALWQLSTLSSTKLKINLVSFAVCYLASLSPLFSYHMILWASSVPLERSEQNEHHWNEDDSSAPFVLLEYRTTYS